MSSCLSCNKPLSLAESVQRGMGPVCAARADRDASGSDSDAVDLPFDFERKDIVCSYVDGVAHFNIYQVFRHHSPSGMSWGYAGSGCSDFALNILEHFCREFEKPKIKLWDKQKVCPTSWNLHIRFKDEFVAVLPKTGGTIKGDDIRQWLCDKTYGRMRWPGIGPTFIETAPDGIEVDWL
jgi:hypothetical protein